jgi:hypothetical protein
MPRCAVAAARGGWFSVRASSLVADLAQYCDGLLLTGWSGVNLAVGRLCVPLVSVGA